MSKEMMYSEFADVYESLAKTSKRLEKEDIISDFLKVLADRGKSEWIYLIRGKVNADYDPKEFGISGQLTIKAIAKSLGIDSEKIVESYRKVGDLGEIAEEFVGKKKQKVLFSHKLGVQKVFENLRKIMEVSGKGAVSKKLDYISELLGSASGIEAKYIVRTLLGDLRIGVADAVLREGIVKAFLIDIEGASKKIEEVYDLSNDFALVFESAKKGLKALEKIDIVPGRGLNVMLPIKVNEISEAFRICGSPAAFEHKYDGFRVVISKNDQGEIKLFTRKLEEVTSQFPDVVKIISTHIKAKSFILDSEVVGFDPKTEKYKPFEFISQRIRRKYDIDKLVKTLPVEVNVFDILYYNGKSLLQNEFVDRRKIIEKIISKEKLKIRPSFQFVTDSEEKAIEFYHEALKIGEEGIMIKKLNAPYQPGRRVGFITKLKPAANDLDLVITGAEYGSGKRGGLLTSYYIACRDGDKYVEVGKVSSGLKEKKEEGFSFEEMSEMLLKLKLSSSGKYVSVKPKIIVAVTYQNVQKSPAYSSGFALRFPRITAYRPDRSSEDIADINDLNKEFKKGQRSRLDTLG